MLVLHQALNEITTYAIRPSNEYFAVFLIGKNLETPLKIQKCFHAEDVSMQIFSLSPYFKQSPSTEAGMQ